MKQDNAKKAPKWLWIVIAIVALLAAAAVALVFLLPGQSSEGEQPVEGEAPASAVYWNLDRIKYTQDSETGLSTREPGEDGLYTFRFASEGKVIELKTADKQLVNYIDTMDAVGLVLDANGLIIDVLNVKDIAIEKAKNFYVKKVDGNTITVNSSVAMNGMDIILVLTDVAKIMDVRPDSETIGQIVDLEVMDMVSVYCDKNEVVTAVYLHERSVASPLYLRVDRLYSSATASTTRVPDENGVYTIPFALHGEVLQLKCKDKNIVTGIDSGTDSKQVMGLTFDEEGYITGTIVAATAARGKMLCQVYNVTAINGNQIEATRLMSGSEQGKVVNFTLTEETEIIMNEDGCNHFIGEKVDGLEIYDRVIVWTDMDGNALYIKNDRRRVQGDDIAMYYLKGKKYDSTNKVTTRVPDEKGYYVFELASKGKMVTVKTKDKDMASKMDGDSYQFFGLKVKGGIVQEFYNLACLSGGYGIGGQRFVTEVMANIVRIVSGSDFASGGNYMLTDKTEIYNMTGYNGKLGSKTTLQVGDRVICARDVENNITHIYVLDRPVSGGTKMYYSAARKYNSTTLETSRTPDAEGYYVFDMFCEGKQVQVKTKDKEVATMIDLQNAPIAAMKVNSEGIVTAAYPAIAGAKYTSKVFNYNYVGEITKDKVVSCYYYSNGVKMDASKSYPMAKNCKVYNVSTNYASFRGEKSSIKVGDQIQALVNIQTGELTHIWIINRAINSPLYFHVGRVAPVNGVTQRVPNADGYYECQLFADGQIKTYRTKDIEIMSAVDSYGSETFFTLKLDGDIILATGAATSSTRSPLQMVSHQDVIKISGKTITTERKRPAQSNTGATTEFKITSKTKIYDVCYYSENQFKEVKLEKGDRVMVYGDRDGNVNYVFVMYPHTREKGYQAKCSHCNKTVWWEPYLGSFIASDELIHYYLPTDRTRSQGTMGKADQTIRYNAVFDMNGCTLTSTGRNFLVYGDLTIIDSVGGGILEAKGYNGGAGGNFMVSGGTVEVNDGVLLRMSSDPEARSSKGGNFIVSNLTVGDKKYTGKVTINDAKLEGWPNSSGNFLMSVGTILNLNGGTVSGGNIELVDTAKFNWKGGTIESNITINGGVLPLEGKPNFSGILMTSNGGKVDISKLSTEAQIKVVPSGVFTTESDNIDAYLNVFVPAAETISIVKDGKALSASVNVPGITENLEFVPGTQLAVCPACEAMVTWAPITQAQYGETAYGTPGDGVHLYLAEDVNHSGTAAFINAPSRDTATNTPYVACFHLNGHNMTTARNFAHGSYGILQIMGSGTLTGDGTNGAVITINTNRDTGGMSLLSGTYKKAAGNTTGVVQINNNGGTVWVGKDAIIETEEDELAISVGTSGLIPSVLEIYGTVKGGYVTMADAKPEAGFTNTFVLDGGNVEGGIKLSKTNIIGLGGAAKVGGFGLDLTSGAKIMVSELTEGASVAVAANGVFTETINVDAQKGFYTAAPKYNAIEVVGQTLSTTRDPNAAPDIPKDPATPAKPTLLSVDNSNLVLSDANEALCPVCNKTVVWTAITDVTGVQALEGGMHYYLPADINYTEATLPYIQAYKSTVSCLHLNGHNITATNAMAIEVKGKLNIMGNGIVSGNGQPNEQVSSRPDLQAATLQINADGAILNIYGGTYVKSAANDSRIVLIGGAEKSGANNIVSAHGNGGTINLFDGATIDATGTKKKAVQSYWAYFNMYGGEVIGGDQEAINYGNWTNAKSGRGIIHGGKVTVTNTTYAAISVGGIAGAPGILEVYGGQINGSLNYSRESNMIIGGNPYIKRVNVPSNMDGTYKGLFTLGRLTEGADITVYGSNVIFTNMSENVETYLQYFKAQSGKSVVVKDYALALAAGGSTPTPDPEPDTPALGEDPKVPALPTKLSVDNSNLVLDAASQAKCPVCDKVVTWTAVTAADLPLAMVGDTHYYLAEDITFESTTTALSFSYNKEYKGKPSCLHLNGKNLTTTSGACIFVGMELNVMGNGTVSGNKTVEGRGATMEVNSSAAIANIYGGTFVKPSTNEYATVQMNTAGGILNFYQGVTVDNRNIPGVAVRNFNGTVNVYGGEFYGGTKGGVFDVQKGTSSGNAVAGKLNFFGGLARASQASGLSLASVSDVPVQVGIYGGEIRGGTDVKGSVQMIIGGTAVMNRLRIADGVKITLAEMSEGASITLSANGIFTNPSKNAATYVKYFHGLTEPEPYKTPTVVDNALFTEQGTDPEQPGTEPEQPKPVEPKFDNSNLVFEEGTNKAKCPACGEVVEWTAVTQAANGTTSIPKPTKTGSHYYLAEDITYTGTDDFFYGPGSSYTLCIHLNGHNFTSTQARFLFGFGSKSRVMGNGIVATGKPGAGVGGVAWNTGTKTNVDIQLYGGTYTVTPENTTGSPIAIQNNGGDITIHEGVKVFGSATAPAIYVGTSSIRTSVLTIKGATVDGTIQINAPKTPATYATTIAIEDSKIAAVELGKDVSFTIAGNTEIGKLEVAAGAKFTVGQLGSAAKIAVLGNGTVSEANTNMATYFGCFKPYYGELKLEGNALVASHQTAIDNSNLVFEEGTQKATCPYCKKSVEWTPITEITAELVLAPESHYYLANDITCSVSTQAIAYKYDAAYSRKITCLHLNGKNLTNEQGLAIFAGNYLNVMGNGIVSGNLTTVDRGATVEVNSTVGRLNLFGGTYVKPASNTINAIVNIHNVGGVLNMYEGVTIDGTGLTTETAPTCVRMAGTQTDVARKAILNIYGGTIQNGTVTASNGGNIRIYYRGEINMYGGLITGGKATATASVGYGGNVYASTTLASINILGGTISNGEARIGGNIAVKGFVVTIKNAAIIGGTTATNANGLHGGNISIDAGTVLNLEMGTVVANGTAKGQGGNIRCYQGTVNMNGGVVYGGTVQAETAVNHNIWVAGDSTTAASMTLTGGLVLGKANVTKTGSAIHCSGVSSLTLDGDAIVIDNSAVAGVRVPAGKLTTAATWTGIANVANA